MDFQKGHTGNGMRCVVAHTFVPPMTRFVENFLKGHLNTSVNSPTTLPIPAQSYLMTLDSCILAALRKDNAFDRF